MHRLLLSVPLSLVLAASASADTTVLGSDLSGTPSFAVSNPNDWSAWGTSAVGSTKVPADGEVNAVSIKGVALDDYTKFAGVSINVLVLHPNADGTLSPTVTSQGLNVPVDPTGLSAPVTRFDRAAMLTAGRMCAKKGDFVALFTNGGAEVTPGGIRLQVFRRNTGSAFDLNKAAVAPTSGYANFRGTTQTDQELLMQVEFGTGGNARPFCGGTEGSGGGGGNPSPSPTATAAPGATPAPTAGPAPTPAGPATLTVEQKGKPVVKHRKLAIKLACAAAQPCGGTLSLVRGAKTLGSKPVTVAAGATSVVRLKLSAAGYSLFKAKGSTLNVTVKVSSGGAVDKQNVRIVKPGLA